MEQRASQEEIFQYLRALLGDEAVEVVENVAQQYSAGDTETALQTLKEYDKTLGGMGIYKSQAGRKLPGIYRALSYVEMPMQDGHAHKYSRTMVWMSCVYLEELIKRLVHLWPWEAIRADTLPLGILVKRIRKRLPDTLAENLEWLNRRVGIFAKHHGNLRRGREPGAPEPESYFGVDEAIAVYLIARTLGRQLEELSGKPEEAFLEG